MDTNTQKHAISKTPPQAVDLETAVLGAILLEKAALIQSIPLLHSDEIFFIERHRLIMKAIRQLFESGIPVDIMTVSNELRKMGSLADAGGASYVTELTSLVAGGANVEYHIRILQEHWMKRRMIQIAGDLTKGGYDEKKHAYHLLHSLQTQVVQMVEGVDNVRTVGIR